ncbi:MAG: shikimate kinase [Opitutaceae bacterium]|jgi:shikimate kinase|nr:shikimate kinase [Opitutaceae bacterium]
MSATGRNLYLIGFMGTGKSSVGRLAAQRLGLGLIDSDQAIERAEGRSITEIFCKEGEGAFREMERRFAEEGHAPGGLVVSCGGGLVMAPGMLERLKAKGVVICLHASAETVLARTAGKRHRPLLEGGGALERIRRLMAERERVYRGAHAIVLTDGRTLAEVAEHVARAYRDLAGGRS